MKKILFLTAICLAVPYCYAQEPELFGTWYLYEVLAHDLHDLYIVSEIDPTIAPPPTMTINESFTIQAVGACNTFEGQYEFNTPGNEFEIMDFTMTDNDCGFAVHNAFEGSFFGFIHYFWYTLGSDSGGLTLYLENVFFGYALLKNYPLSTQDFDLASISLYPNPAAESLNISSPNIKIETLTIRNATGQQISKLTNTHNTVDVSGLPKGVYFLEIVAVEGQVTKKFVKD